MGTRDPVAELEPQFSSDDATATPWAQARAQLETAEIYPLGARGPLPLGMGVNGLSALHSRNTCAMSCA